MYKHNNYAGFWKRFVAYLIDEIIISIVGTILIIPLLIIIFVIAWHDNDYEKYVFASRTYEDFIQDLVYSPEFYLIVLLAIVYSLMMTVIKWLYHALMESGVKQATIGKIILSLKVTDKESNRIGFSRATGRHFGKIISGLIFSIGFIIAAFTERKQALHDMLSGCLVLDNSKTKFYSSNFISGNTYETL